jgi:hypothetical protein
MAGILRQILTWGIAVGVDLDLYTTRYCYEHEEDARAALRDWTGVGDPPGPWIKQKPENRLNPNFTKGEGNDHSGGKGAVSGQPESAPRFDNE